MKQSKKENKNIFRCPVCDQLKKRGIFVKILRGQSKGLSVKTCQKPLCIELAMRGEWLGLMLKNLQENKENEEV